MREIVQQWQYISPLQEEMLHDKVFDNCNEVGITSLQSYVPWAKVEQREGLFDFSEYVPLVEKIKQHGLMWTPFIIFGPYYATPEWFQNSAESLYACCLEHDQASRIQSIWNPLLAPRVLRFLQATAEFCREIPLESVCLGIGGNWGEAIYPHHGCFIGGFHTHQGYWCGDVKAVADFRIFLQRRYEKIEDLNMAWKTSFKNFSEVIPPRFNALRGGWRRTLYRKLPRRVRLPLLKMFDAAVIYRRFSSLQQQRLAHALRRRLDFTDWYTESMTNHATLCLDMGRRCFPSTDLYLVTGGVGHPESGADFVKQAEVAAKFGAGLRITNQTDAFEKSFVITNLVATAARHCHISFGTEEAWINTPEGTVMRVFDTVGNGATVFYSKGLINTWTRHDAPGDATGLPMETSYLGETLATITPGGRQLQKNRILLDREGGVPEVAVYYPQQAISLDGEVLYYLHKNTGTLRHAVPLAFIDETLIGGHHALAAYRFLVWMAGDYQPAVITREILAWVRRGGVLLLAATIRPYDETGADATLGGVGMGVHGMGLGWCAKIPAYGTKLIRSIVTHLANQNRQFPWQPVTTLNTVDHTCYTCPCTDNSTLIYNPTLHTITTMAGSGGHSE